MVRRRVSDTASSTTPGVASHVDIGGPQPFIGSAKASTNDTRLTRAEGGSSDRANDSPRKGLASSNSATMARSRWEESSRVVSTPGAVGAADGPRWARATPVFDYACHEGKYSLPLMLRGARVQEREAAAAEGQK